MPSSQVFKKFRAGKLHSGSKTGPVVHDPEVAKAIYMSERRNEAEYGHADSPRGKKPHRRKA